ncbi:hypothetical protein BESB_038940 [Besnoitia besnoiti]|uniref:Transmembrane protein n=1 Tax=Besnoitia besnoiti TaxID=94643 RepID=A0A2A9MMS3_BESBE|nr:hypothetical protein BESB_038940 [Besnoitia besnoiti]PFH37436.1 hypothetical protein BESB_038940 [Besnoitia besnoiti]
MHASTPQPQTSSPSSTDGDANDDEASRIFHHFASGQGEELLTCAEWKPVNKWDGLAKSFCQRLRKKPTLAEICEQAAADLIPKLTALYVRPGPNPVPEVVRQLSLYVLHPLIPRGKTAAPTEALGRVVSSIGASDVSRFQASLSTQSCSVKRTLQTLGERANKDTRKSRKDTIKSTEAREAIASRYLVLLEQVPAPDPVYAGLVVALVNLKPCLTRRRRNAKYHIPAGNKSIELKHRDAVVQAFAGAFLTAFYPPQEHCNGYTLSHNCAVLKGFLQARRALDSVAESVIQQAKYNSQSQVDAVQADMNTAAGSEADAELEDVLLQSKLSIYFTVRVAAAASGNSGAILGFFGRSKVLAKLIAKVALKMKSLITQIFGDGPASVASSEAEVGTTRALREVYIASTSAAVTCVTSRIGLANVTANVLVKLVKAAAEAAAKSRANSTSFLDIAASPAGDSPSTELSARQGEPLAIEPHQPADAGRTGALMPIRLISFAQKRTKSKNKSWDRWKPGLVGGAFVLLAIAIGTGAAYSFLWAAPWAIALVVVGIFSFLVATVLIILLSEKAILRKWFKRGARAAKKAEEEVAKALERRRMAEARMKRNLERNTFHSHDPVQTRSPWGTPGAPAGAPQPPLLPPSSPQPRPADAFDKTLHSPPIYPPPIYVNRDYNQ